MSKMKDPRSASGVQAPYALSPMNPNIGGQTHFKSMNILVDICAEEIRLHAPKVNRDLADTLRTVEKREHAKFSALLNQSFERQTDRRHARDGIEDSQAHPSTLSTNLLDLALERGHKDIIFNWPSAINAFGLRGSALDNILDRLVEATINFQSRVSKCVSFTKATLLAYHYLCQGSGSRLLSASRGPAILHCLQS